MRPTTLKRDSLLSRFDDADRALLEIVARRMAPLVEGLRVPRLGV